MGAAVRRVARLRPRVWGALVVLLVAAGIGGWLWLRDSSLVRVEQVTVSGATGPEAPAVRSTLERAARDMTTLNLDVDRLRRAVATYPQVKDLEVQAHPLHRVTIEVVERLPVAALRVNGHRTPVAADGTLLRGRISSNGLPDVNASAPPVGGRLTHGAAADALAMLAAAPRALRRHIARLERTGEGYVAQLRDGPRVLLGDGERPRAKWVAAARVLSDAGSEGAAYVDVRLPDRPAAGGFPVAATEQLSTSTEG